MDINRLKMTMQRTVDALKKATESGDLESVQRNEKYLDRLEAVAPKAMERAKAMNQPAPPPQGPMGPQGAPGQEGPQGNSVDSVLQNENKVDPSQFVVPPTSPGQPDQGLLGLPPLQSAPAMRGQEGVAPFPLAPVDPARKDAAVAKYKQGFRVANQEFSPPETSDAEMAMQMPQFNATPAAPAVNPNLMTDAQRDELRRANLPEALRKNKKAFADLIPSLPLLDMNDTFGTTPYAAAMNGKDDYFKYADAKRYLDEALKRGSAVPNAPGIDGSLLEAQKNDSANGQRLLDSIMRDSAELEKLGPPPTPPTGTAAPVADPVVGPPAVTPAGQEAGDMKGNAPELLSTAKSMAADDVEAEALRRIEQEMGGNKRSGWEWIAMLLFMGAPRTMELIMQQDRENRTGIRDIYRSIRGERREADRWKTTDAFRSREVAATEKNAETNEAYKEALLLQRSDDDVMKNARTILQFPQSHTKERVQWAERVVRGSVPSVPKQ